MGLGAGYKGTGNLDATVIRTPDRPAYYKVPHNRLLGSSAETPLRHFAAGTDKLV